MILNNLASNLSAGAALSPVNSGGYAAVTGQGQSVSLSGAGTSSGGQGGFSETLNSSINNSINSGGNPTDNTAVNQQLNNAGTAVNSGSNNTATGQLSVNAGNTGNNSGSNQPDNTVNAGVKADASPAGKAQAGPHAEPEDKSKKGGIKNSGNNSGGQAAYFIGNSSIILQPVSLKKLNNTGGNDNGQGKNTQSQSADTPSSGGSAETDKSNKTLSSDISNNAAAALSAGWNTAKAANSNQPQNNYNNTNAKDQKNIAGNNSAPGGAALLNLNSANVSDSQSPSAAGDAAISSHGSESGGQANNSAASAAAQDGANKNTGDASKTYNASDAKISPNKSNSYNTAAQNSQNNTAENKANIAANASASAKSADINNVNADANALVKNALANSLNLTALNGEVKSVLSEADGKNSVLGSGTGNAGSNGAGTANNKVIDFINAGSSQSAAAGIANPSSNGNPAGFNLSGGHISGANDSAGETSGSVAVNSVMFMLRKNVQSATITLNPQSLGSVKIDITLNTLSSAASGGNGSITINMLAQNEAAKNILQSSSDSLQNALKNQGFSSINLNISSGSGYNNQTGGNGNETLKNPFINNSYGENSFSNGSSGSGGGLNGLNTTAYRNPEALIDYFV